MKIRFASPSNPRMLCRLELDLNFVIPQQWNDLTPWQVRAIGKFMFNNRNEQLESDFVKNVLICILILPKPTIKNFIKSSILLARVPLSVLRTYTDFMFEKSQAMTSFPDKIKAGKWPKKTTLFGPAARLANVTAEELAYADMYFYKWQTEDNPDDLHRLVAILYRPGKDQSDPIDQRIDFSPLLLEKNAHMTDHIPLHLKYMIAHAFGGSMQLFYKRHPNVFPKRKPVEGEDQKPEKKRQYHSFSKIIDSMAMDDVQIFGTRQDVEKVFAPKFLAVYEENIIREREKERKNSRK